MNFSFMIFQPNAIDGNKPNFVLFPKAEYPSRRIVAVNKYLLSYP